MCDSSSCSPGASRSDVDSAGRRQAMLRNPRQQGPVRRKRGKALVGCADVFLEQLPGLDPVRLGRLVLPPGRIWTHAVKDVLVACRRKDLVDVWKVGLAGRPEAPELEQFLQAVRYRIRRPVVAPVGGVVALAQHVV